MYQWIARHNKLFMVVCTALLSVMVFVIIRVFYISLTWWAIATLFIALVVWRFTENCFIKAVDKIMNILTQDCDPLTPLKTLGKLIVTAKSKSHIQLMLVYKAVCLQKAGRAAESLEILKNIHVGLLSRFSSENTIIYYSTFCSVYIQLNAPEKSRIYLEKTLMVLQDLSSSKLKNELFVHHLINQMRLDLFKPITHDTEHFINETIKMSDCPLYLAEAYFTLGQIYEKQGLTEQAKECFLYTTDHGNKLDCAIKAKSQIELL